MKTATEKTSGGVDARGDDVPLLLAAAILHPERPVRTGIRAALSRWVDDARPEYTAAEVEAVLRSHTGTAIEPFVLDRRDRYLAILLARLAFSEREACTRFRVVSRETIGEDGGLMLTNNLRAFYIERYALGYRRRTPGHFGFVAPRSMPPESWFATRKGCAAEARVDDQGISLRIGPLDWPSEMEVEPDRLTRQLALHSTIHGATTMSLDRGFRIARDGNRLLIQTAGGESILQLSAHMAQGSMLVLSAADSGLRARVFVRLRPLESDRMRLPCVTTATSRSLPRWVRVEEGPGPEISRELRLAVASWFRPHDGWIDEPLLEALL
jgi:hypothetical protein